MTTGCTGTAGMNAPAKTCQTWLHGHVCVSVFMNSSAQQKFYAVINHQEMQRRAEKPEPE